MVIALEEGGGLIRREDGEVVLVPDVGGDWGQPLRGDDPYEPVRVGLADDGLLIGGRMPPGAVGAELVDASGERHGVPVQGGYYAAALSDGPDVSPALAFRDAAGAFVHRPLPAAYPHQPVEDAEVPCPVCGAMQYELYLPTEEWRAGRGRKGTDSFVPGPLIICRVCGLQEHGGGITRYSPAEVPEGDEMTEAERQAREARARAERTLQRWYAHTMTLSAVTFPIYAAEGLPARINGQASRGDDLTSLTVGQAESLGDGPFVERPTIEVTTSADPHERRELTVAREVYASLIESDGHEPPRPGLSDPAMILWFRAHRRARAAAGALAPTGEIAITIEGTPEPFLLIGAPPARWAAVRRHHGLTVTVAARDTDPGALVIEPVADPVARLVGPRPPEPADGP